MKLRCDVCSAGEATVYCTADEAALCGGCDHRVHHANKLASKHQRFSLLHPSSKDFPLCDVCQEKRAFLFCQQDRAILCKDCDGSIHKANEHTLKHNRFLLTGIKLSNSSAVYLPNSSNNEDSKLKDQQFKKQKGFSVSKSSSDNSSSSSESPISSSSTVEINTAMNNKAIDNEIDPAGSTISEYLMETLPGWCVEDLLDFPSAPFGFCKVDEEILPMIGTDLGGSMNPLWVPQAPKLMNQSNYLQIGSGFKEGKEISTMKNSRNWADDGFTVPQMSPPSKRNRSFW